MICSLQNKSMNKNTLQLEREINDINCVDFNLFKILSKLISIKHFTNATALRTELYASKIQFSDCQEEKFKETLNLSETKLFEKKNQPLAEKSAVGFCLWSFLFILTAANLAQSVKYKYKMQIQNTNTNTEYSSEPYESTSASRLSAPQW